MFTGRSGAVPCKPAVIQGEFGIPQAAVSRHLRVLRASGLARVRPEGAGRIHAVEAALLRESDESLARFHSHWEPRLDTLATGVARGKQRARPPWT